MDVELAIDPEAVAGLARLKFLTSSRTERPKTQSVKIVWHDSPEHALLLDGLALAEQRGHWRLERIVPGTDTWLPGQPAPIVTHEPDLSSLPSPLAPLAAFEGRRTTSVHYLNDASVALTIEKGNLRAVTAEREVARVHLAGEPGPVRAVALMIVESAPVTVPLASLPGEGIGLATGRPPAPRHLGAPVLPEAVTNPAEALAHIIGHLTDVILAHAPLAASLDDAGTEAVHQMRVAVRRARSALSVFRSAVEPGVLDAVNADLRALGHQLGPSRDWDVFAEETLPVIREALPDDERLHRMASAASRRRRELRTALTAYLGGAEFRRIGIELAWFVAAGCVPAVIAEPAAAAALSAFSAEVLQHRWKKLVSSCRQMDELDIPGLHGVRLRAKRARYAAEMFSTLYQGKAPQRFIRRLSDLQQQLGVLNDGAVATHLLDELGGASGRHAYAVGLVAGYMAARTRKIRPRIITAFEKFRRQPAYWT